MEHKAARFISENEYLAIESASDVKSEYFRGEVFAIAGATREHNIIVANVIAELIVQLKKRRCIVYPSYMRLKVQKTGLYAYPDGMIICDKKEVFADEKKTTLLNPDVIIEVLSDNTESYDRGEKFFHYRQLDSLKEYALIGQRRKKIEKYAKTTGPFWTLSETDDENSIMRLDSIGCQLDLANVYDKLEI
jgi:Uma2 family endonuclease